MFGWMKRLKVLFCNHIYAMEHDWRGEEIQRKCVKCGRVKK